MLNSFQHPWTWRFRYIPSRCSWIPKQVRDDRKRTNRSLARPPFLPEPVPIGQPLGDLNFKAARRRGVEALRLHLFRPVIVAGKGVGRVMVVIIVAAIADGLHQLCRRVQNVLWRHQRSGVAGCALRRLSALYAAFDLGAVAR